MTARRTAIRDRHRKVLAASGAACHICGQPIDYTLRYPDPMSFVADHVVPLNRGGADRLENKRAAHRGCNSEKSDREFGNIIRRSGSLDASRRD